MAPIRLGLLLLASALASAQDAHVHTSREHARRLPLPKSREVWHFCIFGDRTGGPAEGIEILAQAVADANLLDPDLVMTVGDLINGYNEPKAWLAQMREFKETMNGLRMPWYPVAGNHDIYWRGSSGEKPPAGEHEQNYEKHFGPLWYHFRHKTAGFIVLYSDELTGARGIRDFRDPACQKMSDEQKEWLKVALRAHRDAEHIFLFLHHPRWIASSYPGSDWDEVHAILRTQPRVRAVFAGHIHQLHYAGERDGIAYYALAATGAHLRDAGFPQAGYLHHLDVVTVRRNGISVAAIPIGQVIDPREFTPGRLQDMDDLRTRPRLDRNLVLTLDAEGALDQEVVVPVSNPGKRPIEVTVWIDPVDSRVWFHPGHEHATIAPGQSAEFRFHARRRGLGRWGPFDPPKMIERTEYIAETARIALPDREHAFSFHVPSPPPEPADSFDAALVLDGRGSCLRIDHDRFHLHDGPFTIEGFVHPFDIQGRRPFLAKTESSEWGLFLDDGRATFFVHLDGKYVSARSAAGYVRPGRWYHIAGVFDGGEIRLYGNGRLLSRTNASGKRTPNRLPFYIGADPDKSGAPVDSLHGLIDRVRLSDSVRYQGASFTPAASFAPDEATILLVDMDDEFAGFFRDRGRSGAHPVRVGAARSVPAHGPAAR